MAGLMASPALEAINSLTAKITDSNAENIFLYKKTYLTVKSKLFKSLSSDDVP